MIIENCPACGGTHVGSTKCPYRLAPCVVCGLPTILACSDCAIDTAESVHVCGMSSCRDQHEAAVHAVTSTDSREST